MLRNAMKTCKKCNKSFSTLGNICYYCKTGETRPKFKPLIKSKAQGRK